MTTPPSISRRSTLAVAGTAALVGLAGDPASAATTPSDRDGRGPGRRGGHGDAEAGVSSPDGRTTITVRLDADGRPTYRVLRDGATVVASSSLGLRLHDADLSAGLRTHAVGRPRRGVESYRLHQGKVGQVRRPFVTRRITWASPAHPDLLLGVDIVATDEGVAVRHRLDGRGAGTEHTVLDDATAVVVPVPDDGGVQLLAPHTATSPKDQEFYIQRDDHRLARLGEPVRSSLGAFDGGSFPMLLRTAARGRVVWLLVGETGNDARFPSCHVAQPSVVDGGRRARYGIAFPTDDEALGTFGPGAPVVRGPWAGPWRFIAVGDDAASVAETTLATDLAPACRLADTSWVRPGSAAFSWLTAPTSPTSLEASLRWIDLAAALGWPYALIDAKWDTMTDAGGASVPLERLVAEADARGVRLFLWYNSAGTNNNASANTPRDRLVDPALREAELARLAALGVAGLKIDGWQSDKQQLFALQRDVVEAAGRHRLHVVLHNTTAPRGWDRTYPHLLGVEGGIASEYYTNVKPYTDQIPEQSTIAAVVRNAVGAFDYGTTLLRPGVAAGCDRHTTDAHELALAVVYQSGFNGFASAPEDYLGQPDAVRAVLGEVPCAWDETRFLHADPSRSVVVARRSGRTWWVAGINGVTTSISPGLSTAAPDYRRATGAPLRLDVALGRLGLGRHPRGELFHDAGPNDPALRISRADRRLRHVDTAPFGGFLLVLR